MTLNSAQFDPSDHDWSGGSEDHDDPGDTGIGGMFDMKGDWEKSFTGSGVKYTHPAHPGRSFTSDEYMQRTAHLPFDTTGRL